MFSDAADRPAETSMPRTAQGMINTGFEFREGHSRKLSGLHKK
jgi:hypothetical protein